MNQPPRKNRILGPTIFRVAAFVVLLICLDWAIGSILDKGLRLYFGMEGKVDVLCIGHSRTVLGIDAEMLARETGLKVAKYAITGANIVDRAAMIRQFLQEHPEVRIVVYDVESPTFSNDGLSSNSYQLFFPFIYNPEMRAYLQAQCASRVEFIIKSLVRSARYNEVTFSLALRGLLGMNRNLKYGHFDLKRAKRWIEKGKNRPVRIDRMGYQVFMSTMDYINSRNVRILLVDMPTIKLLNEKEYSTSQRVREIFKNLTKHYSKLVYLDLSKTYENNYDIFYDTIHLNARGQVIISKELAKIIRTMTSVKREWK